MSSALADIFSLLLKGEKIRISFTTDKGKRNLQSSLIRHKRTQENKWPDIETTQNMTIVFEEIFEAEKEYTYMLSLKRKEDAAIRNIFSYSKDNTYSFEIIKDHNEEP